MRDQDWAETFEFKLLLHRPVIFFRLVEFPYHHIIYYTCLLQLSTTQCKLRIYTRMQVTPKIIIISYTTLATLKFSTSAYRVVVSTDHKRLNTWPSNYLFIPQYRLKMMHLHAIISKTSSFRGSQPIITTGLICLEYELGVLTVGCMHSHEQQGWRPFGNLHSNDIVLEIN